MDEPTIFSLYDTVNVLSKKNPEWRKDSLCCMIFAWQASIFMDSHADEVCQEVCPELQGICIEYRGQKTINGSPLPDKFESRVLKYIFESPSFQNKSENFGCSPVKDAYWVMEKK